jgi:integrase
MVDKFNFTQERIEKLPIPEQGRIDYYDLKTPKLTCRVSASGNKSFVVLKKNSAGKAQRVTLGRFPSMTVATAQKLANKTLTDLSSGINPTEVKRQEKHQSITLANLLKKYIDQKDLKPLTAADYLKKLEQGFSDWLTKPVNTITRDMVLRRHKSLSGNKTTRDNKMRVLRLLMRYALALKVITESPTDALKDVGLWSKPTRKDRIIPSDRLRDWYDAVLTLRNKKAKVYLLLLLYTGLRANEAVTLKWCDVDLKHDTLTVKDTRQL